MDRWSRGLKNDRRVSRFLDSKNPVENSLDSL